ncbi:MAG: GcvT family protein, partial [Alphaproteobacteria bacterium]
MSAKTIPSKARAVIVGGGVSGCSVAYHLAKLGWKDIVLLERKQLTSGTTWHAAGLIGQLRPNQNMTRLAKYSADLYVRLEEETGLSTGMKQNGSITVALTEARKEEIYRQASLARAFDVDVQEISPTEAKAMYPHLNIDGVTAAVHLPLDGQCDPANIALALAKGARQMGATIVEGVKVTGVNQADGAVTGVTYERDGEPGSIDADVVVNCGGMWARDFAAMAGVTVPLHACEHFYIVTEPVDWLAREQVILNIAEERTYWKEDAGKLLIGGFEAQGKAWARNGIPEDFEFDELPFDMQHAEPELERMFARMPALEGLGIQTFFNGPESFTPDGRPYMGPSAEVEGVFLATGMNSNGILNSGGAGLTMAEWLIDGRPSRSMLPLLAVRAHPFQRNSAYNAERAAESVGFHYGLHWPGRQVTSARGLRRVPLHAELRAAGAAFAERIGWEVPMHFGGGWTGEPSIRWKPWSARMQVECLAARDHAVLLDQSMYAKFILQGPDAQAALSRVASANLDRPVGTSIYTPFLNDAGGIEADVTVTRLAEDRFLVVTGHPSQMRDQHWIRAHADPDWRFELFDATAAFALLSLHGPKSRDILAALAGSPDPVSAAALPFGGAREVDLGLARGWVIRRSFLGELGFELLISAEFAGSVYEALIEAGAPLGLEHMGMFAMNA